MTFINKETHEEATDRIRKEVEAAQAYEIHELSDVFPPMSADEFEALKGDMAVNGFDPNFPIMLLDGAILDGRHRYQAAVETGHVDAVTTLDFVGGYAAARSYAVRANAGRRSLTAAQKAATAAEMVTTDHKGGGYRRNDLDHCQGENDLDNGQGEYTLQAAAADWGISDRIISNMRQVLEYDSAFGTDLHAQAKRGDLSVNAAYTDMRRADETRKRQDAAAVAATERKAAEKAAAKESERQAAVALGKELAASGELYKMIHCPISGLHRHVGEGAVDAIVTDPPYTSETLDAFGELAAFGVYALKPGGVLLAMSGTMFLPEILRRMDTEGLSYRWLVAYHQPGGGSPYHATKITTEWTPILAFTRDGAQPSKYGADFISATAGRHKVNKKYHDWGKDIGAFAALIDEFVEPGGLIVDPFVGGGTTGAAVRKLGVYQFVGADIDEDSVALATKAWSDAEESE